MKRFIKRIFPVLLSAFILVSTGWYLLEYDPGFTRDILLQQARHLEESGRHNAAVWMYNLAYEYFGSNDAVAIELADKFIEMGNFSKAEYTLRKAIEDGGNAELYMALSRTYVLQGKLRDAVMMLENVSGDMKQTLQQLRPATPTASYPSGSYDQYLSVELDAEGSTIYVTTDQDYPSSLTDTYSQPITLPAGETILFAVSVGENGLVSPLAVFNYIIHDVVEVVTFDDPNFEASVRKQLNYSASRVIYSNALWRVTELSLSESVASIADLKWFPNLQTLSLDRTGLAGEAALAGCAQLQKLTIRGCDITPELMAVLPSLQQLQTLELTDCGISNISTLSALHDLRNLDLSNNAIRDISPLRNLTALTHLRLSNNALISIEDLEQLTALQVLDISYNSIVSTLPLAKMTSLLELDLSSNALWDLEGIDSLALLEKLNASNNSLTQLDVLENCSALTHLNVSSNTILDISVVEKLRSLQVFNFSHNEVSQLPEFSKHAALQIIDGSYNQISSLKRLGVLSQLTHVYMDYNAKISSISPLTSCPALQEVYVYGTEVRNVSSLTSKGILVVYSPV